MTPETSYQGVQFTVADQSTLNGDIALILSLESQRRGLDDSIIGIQGSVNFDWDNYNSCLNNLSPGPAQSQCINQWKPILENDKNRLALAQSQIPIKDQQIIDAKKQYNDDLVRIQNGIKIAIQASIENARHSAQLAENQVGINRSNPALLAEQLKLQATLDKQKRDQQMKVIGFILITVIILGIGWYVIKKVL